jgi:hypothetical protein
MKNLSKQSVVKDWVLELPFTQQALLMLSLRGPDGCSKYTPAKYICYFIRDVILHAAYPSYDGSFEPGGFMRNDYDNFAVEVDRFFEDIDGYPMHFLMHLIHASEVIAYNHPDELIRNNWLKFYLVACNNLHMHPETQKELIARLKY